MSFLVPVMVLGAAAALIPLIIHLRNRSRFQVVGWGAMHLLESVLRVNRRRLRIEQLILLAIRMTIPAAIALFMARPVLTGWRALPGTGAKRSVVAALDNSYSMEAGGGDQSSTARMLRMTDDLLADLPRGSDAAILPLAGGGDGGFSRPTVDLRGLRRRLTEVPGGFGVARPAKAIEAAMAGFESMSHADRELVLVSDFQRVSWGGAATADLGRAAERLQAAAIRPHVTLVRCASEPVENISVDALTLSRLVVGVGQKTQIRAVVRNHGSKARNGLRVRLRVDGQDRETTEIAVGPGERAQVLFSHVFEQPGSHYLEVSTDADALRADNTLLAALPVWDRIPVLLVNGRPAREPLRGETDYLETALRPFSSRAARLSDLIQMKVIEGHVLDAGTLGESRVVILANIAPLKQEQMKALEDFVRAGGGLLIFTGEQLDVGWFNATFSGSGAGLMPVHLGGPSGSLSEPAQQAAIAGQHFDHEALTLFNAPENGTIAGAEIWMWHPTGGGAEIARAGERLAVLARLSNGDPFLIERKVGEGRVILCTSAADADWGNLPMRPAYVPFVQQLVTYLASTVYPPRQVEVGGELAAFLPADRAGAKLTLTLPDGSARQITAAAKGPRAVASWAAADRPGMYVLEGAGVPPVHFVVNVSREESDLACLDEKELNEVAALLHADLVSSAAEYRELQDRRRSGREIWRYLFGGALALILLEMVLEQRFARRAG